MDLYSEGENDQCIADEGTRCRPKSVWREPKGQKQVVCAPLFVLTAMRPIIAQMKERDLVSMQSTACVRAARKSEVDGVCLWFECDFDVGGGVDKVQLKTVS